MNFGRSVFNFQTTFLNKMNKKLKIKTNHNSVYKKQPGQSYNQITTLKKGRRGMKDNCSKNQATFHILNVVVNLEIEVH